MRLLNTLKVADKTLKEVKKLLRGKKNSKNGYCAIYPYLNGRERGYAIVHITIEEDIRVTFSENRNSDEIVIYTEPTGFLWDECIPSQEAYSQRDYIPAGQYVRAAKRIVQKLNIR